MAALPFEEIVIAATGLVGVFMTDARTGVVDRASALLRVQEHADASEHLVLLMPENVLAFDDLREADPRGFGVHSEMAGQARQVAFFDHDAVIAAAVRRALGTIVERLGLRLGLR